MLPENCRHWPTPAAIHFAVPVGHSDKFHHHPLDLGAYPTYLWGILYHTKVLQVFGQVGHKVISS